MAKQDRASKSRIDSMMSWGQYWQRSPGTGVAFAEIQSAGDVILARKFCPVFWEGQMFCEATDAEILAVAEALRFYGPPYRRAAPAQTAATGSAA